MNALLVLAALATAFDVTVKGPSFQSTRFGVCPTAPGLAPQPVQPPRSAPPAPMQAAPFESKDVLGTPVRMSDYKGKVVLLDFWATWCGPCKLSTPLLVDLHKRYAEKGLVILGLNGEESWDTVTDYVSRNKIAYRMVIDDGKIRGKYGVQGYPTFILVGKDGVVQWRRSGFGPDTPAALVSEIEAALAR